MTTFFLRYLAARYCESHSNLSRSIPYHIIIQRLKRMRQTWSKQRQRLIVVILSIFVFNVWYREWKNLIKTIHYLPVSVIGTISPETEKNLICIICSLPSFIWKKETLVLLVLKVVSGELSQKSLFLEYFLKII